jgi:hypothetical protein
MSFESGCMVRRGRSRRQGQAAGAEGRRQEQKAEAMCREKTYICLLPTAYCLLPLPTAPASCPCLLLLITRSAQLHIPMPRPIESYTRPTVR